MKWSDYLSSPLVWLGGSSPPSMFEVLSVPKQKPTSFITMVGGTSNVNKRLPPPLDLDGELWGYIVWPLPPGDIAGFG